MVGGVLHRVTVLWEGYILLWESFNYWVSNNLRHVIEWFNELLTSDSAIIHINYFIQALIDWFNIFTLLNSFSIIIYVINCRRTAACIFRPNRVKWHLMIASCHRRSGNYQQALETYKFIHKKFPDNIECLKVGWSRVLPQFSSFSSIMVHSLKSFCLRYSRFSLSSFISSATPSVWDDEFVFIWCVTLV